MVKRYLYILMVGTINHPVTVRFHIQVKKPENQTVFKRLEQNRSGQISRRIRRSLQILY